MKKIVLLMGGESPESEVSLQSGGQILAALRRLQKRVTVFNPADGDLCDFMNRAKHSGKADAVFNILHGGGGENGEVQGLLQTLKIPCTGGGILGAALAMDKHRAKMVWRGAGLPVADWRLADGGEDAGDIINALGLPLFVKPSCGGSSTNSGVAETEKQLAELLAAAAGEGAAAMAETYIAGREYTLSVVGDAPLPIIYIAAARGFYDYHAKYVADDTAFLCPAGLSDADEKRFASLCMDAFFSLGCSSWGRVDFMVDDDGAFYLLEVNTQPGMTSHSLVPMAAAAAGMSFDSLVARILEDACD